LDSQIPLRKCAPQREPFAMPLQAEEKDYFVSRDLDLTLRPYTASTVSGKGVLNRFRIGYKAYPDFGGCERSPGA
jgi:hypothetical protein